MEALRRSDFANINSVILNMPISTEAVMPYIYTMSSEIIYATIYPIYSNFI